MGTDFSQAGASFNQASALLRNWNDPTDAQLPRNRYTAFHTNRLRAIAANHCAAARRRAVALVARPSVAPEPSSAAGDFPPRHMSHTTMATGYSRSAVNFAV